MALQDNPKFKSLSPEAQKIALAKYESLSQEAKNIIDLKIPTHPLPEDMVNEPGVQDASLPLLAQALPIAKGLGVGKAVAPAMQSAGQSMIKGMGQAAKAVKQSAPGKFFTASQKAGGEALAKAETKIGIDPTHTPVLKEVAKSLKLKVNSSLDEIVNAVNKGKKLTPQAAKDIIQLKNMAYQLKQVPKGTVKEAALNKAADKSTKFLNKLSPKRAEAAEEVRIAATRNKALKWGGAIAGGAAGLGAIGKGETLLQALKVMLGGR